MADDDIIDWGNVGKNAPTGGLGYIQQLAASALSAGTQEMVGIHPGDELQDWRNENPKMAMASEMAGMLVPYTGWVKAVKGVKALGGVERMAARAEAAVGGTAGSPFWAGAAREAATLAPFEAARVAANGVVGDNSFAQSLFEGGINTVAGGVLGGGIAKLSSMGKADRALADVFKTQPELLQAPTPVKLRMLDDVIAGEVDPGKKAYLSDLSRTLDSQVRAEAPGRNERYLGDLVSGNRDEVEKLFLPSEAGATIAKRRLVTSGADPDAFRTPAEWQEAVMAAGLPADFTRNVHYPRIIQFGKNRDLEAQAAKALDLDAQAREGYARIGAENADPEAFKLLDRELAQAREAAAKPTFASQAAERVQDNIARNMNPIGDGWFMTRERDNGLFVLAKKYKGEVGDGAARELPATATPDPASLPRVDFSKSPSHIRQHIETARIRGDDLGLTARVEQAAARGKTIGQTVKDLAKDLDVLETGPQGRAEFVKAVRESLGVPGRNAKDFGAWQKEAGARHGIFAEPQLPKGAAPLPASADDAWLIFKTDKPEAFTPKAAQFGNAQVAREKWIVGTDDLTKQLGRPGDFLTEADAMLKRVPVDQYMATAKAEGQGRLGKYIDRVTPRAMKGNAATQHVAQLTREYVAPAAQQLKKSTRGNWVLNMGRMIQDMAETQAQVLVQGKAKLDPSRGMFRQMLTTSGHEGRSLQEIYDQFRASPRSWNEFVKLWRDGTSAGEAQRMAARGQISNETAALARELEVTDSKLMGMMQRTEQAAGKDAMPIRTGHYGISRSWDGDVMTALRDDAGRIVGMAAGNNKTQSIKRAGALAEKLDGETGRPHRVGETFTRDVPEGVPRDLIPYVTNPGFRMQRGNVRGFRWDLDTPTVDEFFKAHSDGVYRRTRYMGNLTRDALLAKDVAALTVEDPFAYKVVTNRFNQMSGIEGEFTKVQNRIVDKVLSPVMGRNSATKIVQVTNQYLNHVMLGALKLSYPISNILGVFQTTAPELAFLMTAPAERVAGYYTMVPARGLNGPVGTMGVLSPMSIMAKSLGEMRKPDAALLAGLERGINERVLGDRVIEEFTGQSAKALGDIRGALSSVGGAVEAIKAVSNFLPASSEKFARAHAFTSAWMMFRDLRGLSGEELYQASKQFVARTQYLYSSADRPMVFTSPLGSSMGLFKNWMLNYMGSMANYAGEGLAHGNWAPLMWQTAGSVAVGGLASTPLVLAANAFTQGFADKNLMQFSYDNFNGKVADGLLYGLPAALTGISFSGSMSEPGANPVRDAAQLFTFAVADRAKWVGKTYGAAMDNWAATGQHPASDPDVRAGLMRAFAPVNMYRTMNTWGGMEEGTVRSPISDLPQIKGLSRTDMWLYRMGMQPLALEKQLNIAEEMYSDKEKLKAATRAMGTTYSDAQREGDSRLMDLVINRALVQGLDIGSVMRSAAANTKLQSQDLTERLSKPEQRAKWGNVLGTE